jgi:hypothetical protein
VEALQGTGQTLGGSRYFIEIVNGAVARVVGVVAGVVCRTWVDAGVVKEEGFVATKSITARTNRRTATLETRGVAGETPVFEYEGGWVCDEVDSSIVGIGGLRTNFVAEMVIRIEVIQTRIVADLAVCLRRTG